MRFVRQLFLLFLFAILVSCARAPIKPGEEPVRITSFPSAIQDDLDFAGLRRALDVTIQELKKKPKQEMVFGSQRIQNETYARALQGLAVLLDRPDDGKAFLDRLKSDFEVIEVFGNDKGWSKVFVTSYFSPTYQGSLTKTPRFQTPVLGLPRDIVRMPIDNFLQVFPDYKDKGLEDLLRDGVLRGKIRESTVGKELIPYDSRSQIRNWKKSSVAPVICYMDPIDHFFLQIQGSGQVQVSPSKTIYLNFAEQNGHPYFPIGRALKEAIPSDKMSLQAIRDHLLMLPPEEVNKILDLNPSYVFFKDSRSKSLTSIGVPAQAGRSIATDSRYFPKGTLGYLTYPAADAGSAESGRFVLDHDTGGAIRGPGRVDLFWGEGSRAELASGSMKGPGQLYFFIPKLTQADDKGKD